MSPAQVYICGVRAEVKQRQASNWVAGRATHPPEEAKMFCWSPELLQAGNASLYEKQRASAVDGASLLFLDREVKNELTWIKRKGDARYPMNKNDRIYFRSDAKQYPSCDSESPVWPLLCSRTAPCSRELQELSEF